MDIYLEIGDSVTFDTNKLDDFNKETDIDNNDVQQYRQLVLAGANQIGIVKSFQEGLFIISYPDGWELPIPSKYLIKLPKI